MTSRVSAPSGSQTITLPVRGEQSVFMELRRSARTMVDMGRENLEKLRERVEALREKTTPEEFLKEMKRELDAMRDSINEGLNTLEAEGERTKPDPNNYDLETPQGREKLKEAEALWMEATLAVLKTIGTSTDFFKKLVEKGVEMLRKIEKGETCADNRIEDFMVWFADEVVKNAKIVAQNVMEDGLATAADEAPNVMDSGR